MAERYDEPADVGAITAGPAESRAERLRGRALQPGRLRREDVYIDEWEDTVTVQGLTGTERDAYEASITIRGKNGQQEIDTRNARAKLIVLCCIDAESGRRVFQRSDITALGRQPASALQKVFDVCRKLSGLADEETPALVEDFESGQSESTTSA